MNVLVTSISKKVPLLLAVKEALGRFNPRGKLYGADSNSSCIGSFFVDHFWQMPSLSEMDIAILVQFCKKNNIRAIIPTRDGELLFFAQYKAQLLDNGIHVMVSNEVVVRTCLDKLLFSTICKTLGIPAIPSFQELERMEANHFVVKSRFGAGSKELGLQLDREEAFTFSRGLKEPIFQPYIDGDELSIDMYIRNDGKVHGIVARTRDVVIDGESQISSTIRHDVLEEMCIGAAEELKLYGHVTMQVIQNNNYFYLIECNCRFGGASTLSLRVGIDSFYWFLLECVGEGLEQVPFTRLNEEKRLIRYPQDMFLSVSRTEEE